MELPYALFDEITGLGNLLGQSDQSDPDRRQHRRLPFGSRGSLSPIRDGEVGPTGVVMLRDISIGGIGFLHADPLKPGDTFIIRFTGLRGISVKVQCVTQRCDPGGTGGTQFAIGATFQHLLEPSTIPPKSSDEDAVSSDPNKDSAVPPLAPINRLPPRASSLFLTPKIEAVSNPRENALSVVATAVATLVTPPSVPTAVAPAVVTTVPEPVVEAASVPQATQPDWAPSSEPTPAPISEPASAPISEPTPAAAVVVQPAKELSARLMPEPPSSERTPAPASNDQPIANFAGKNQGVVAQVKERLMKQNHALGDQIRQLEESKKQLVEQKAALAEVTRQRDALHAMFVKAGQQLAEEQERAARETEALRREVLQLKETVKEFQAKSETDDRAIAELAAVLEREPEVALTTA